MNLSYAERSADFNPMLRFSAVSQQVLAFAQAATPNRPGLVPGTSAWVRSNYVVTGGTTTSPTNKISGKVDQNLGYKHHLSFFVNRTVFDSGPGPSGVVGLPQPLWNGSVSHFEASDYRLSHDWTVTPRLLNHFSVGGNTFFKNSYSPNSGKNCSWSIVASTETCADKPHAEASHNTSNKPKFFILPL